LSIIGNTVRLQATFKRFDGILSDPESLTFKVYDSSKRLIFADNLTNINKISVGLYYYDYLIPNGIGDLTYEFSGILEGSVILGRGNIDREFKSM